MHGSPRQNLRRGSRAEIVPGVNTTWGEIPCISHGGKWQGRVHEIGKDLDPLAVCVYSPLSPITLKKENIMSHVGEMKTPERQSQVAEQINHLESNLELLHGKIGTLTDRLSSVLKAPEVPKEGESKDRVELVVLAGTIQGFNDSGKSVMSKVEDILKRLEL